MHKWGSVSPEIDKAQLDMDLATELPIGFTKQHKLLPLRMDADEVLVATADP